MICIEGKQVNIMEEPESEGDIEEASNSRVVLPEDGGDSAEARLQPENEERATVIGV
jgi:hypothetical protein